MTEEEKKITKRLKDDIALVTFNDNLNYGIGNLYVNINDLKIILNLISKLQADIEKRISFEVIKELKNKIDDKISEVETNRSYGRYKQYGGKIKLDSYLAQLYGHKKAFEMLLEMEKNNDTKNK